MVRNALIAIYILVVLTISVVARASILPAMGTDLDENVSGSLQKHNYETHAGELAVRGNEYVLVTQNQILPLRSQFDMSAFIGSQVMISGIEQKNQFVSKMNAEVVDPLPGFSFGNEAFFVVLGITQITQ